MGAYSPVDKAISIIPHFTAAVSIYGSVLMVGIHDRAARHARAVCGTVIQPPQVPNSVVRVDAACVWTLHVRFGKDVVYSQFRC